MLKSIDNTFRKRIQYAIKNREDLATLLEGYDISYLNLDNSIISKLDITNETIRGTSFCYSSLGTEKGGIVFNNAILIDCAFQDSRFNGKVMARMAQFIGCNFRSCYLPYAEYQYSLFSNCTWCGCVFRLGTRESLGAKFDDKFFGDMHRFLGIKIIQNDEYERLKKLEEKYGQSNT